MPTINAENAKSIRQSMSVHVKIEADIDGESVVYEYDNNDILSCELNLRSDLSPIEPTLPESEIIVRVYSAEDVSDVVKYISNDQPLTYWAGYDGDYSTVRKFYISEPVTYADHVITYKAVDAVHFLDHEIAPYWCGTWSYVSSGGLSYFNWDKNSGGTALTTGMAASYLSGTIYHLLVSSGITPTGETAAPAIGGDAVAAADCRFLVEGNARDIIANLINIGHIELPATAFNKSLWLNYIDAGIPTMKNTKPSSSWDIYAADCGDIKSETARDIVEITAPNKSLLTIDWDRGIGLSNGKVGSVSITYGSGASVSLDKYAMVGCAMLWAYPSQFFYPDALGSIKDDIESITYVDGSVWYNAIGTYIYKDGGFMPWDSNMAAFWREAKNRNIISADATTASFDLYNAGFDADPAPTSYTRTGSGVSETLKAGFYGLAKLKGRNGVTYTLLPNMGQRQLLNRSNKTGSFTWKGDPRMQPRDVFTYHYLDGTTELRTIESINLMHEGGGTVAQITYRKGIV